MTSPLSEIIPIIYIIIMYVQCSYYSKLHNLNYLADIFIGFANTQYSAAEEEGVLEPGPITIRKEDAAVSEQNLPVIVTLRFSPALRGTIITEGSDTHINSVRDFEIFRFQERFRDFSRFLLGFPDFSQDFQISVEISRFQSRFQDFSRDFQISVKISRFQSRFHTSSSVRK